MNTFDIIISSLPIYLVLFFAFLVHFKAKQTNKKQFLYLRFFFGVSAVYYFILLFYFKNEINVLKVLFPFVLPTFLLIIPSFYLYILSIASKKIKKTTVFFHLLPSSLFFVLLIPFYFFTNEQKNDFLQFSTHVNHTILVDYIRNVFFIGVVPVINLQVLIYIVLFIRILYNFNKKIEQNFSYKERINLSWTIVMIVFLFSLIIILNYADILGVKSSFVARLVFNFVSSSIFLFLYVNAIKQKIIFEQTMLESKPEPEPEMVLKTPEFVTKKDIIEPKKYKSSTLKTSEKNRIIIEIEQLQKSSNFFYDQDLNLSTLSRELKTNTSYLSQIINDHFGTNFFHFVNKVRLDKAVELMNSADFEVYTIEAIAKLCGFRSKSSFYDAFKKVYNQTPSQVKKRAQ